jgi:hypothetical protein
LIEHAVVLNLSRPTHFERKYLARARTAIKAIRDNTTPEMRKTLQIHIDGNSWAEHAWKDTFSAAHEMDEPATLVPAPNPASARTLEKRLTKSTMFLALAP